jgi:hypothetical protein
MPNYLSHINHLWLRADDKTQARGGHLSPTDLIVLASSFPKKKAKAAKQLPTHKPFPVSHFIPSHHDNSKRKKKVNESGWYLHPVPKDNTFQPPILSRAQQVVENKTAPPTREH